MLNSDATLYMVFVYAEFYPRGGIGDLEYLGTSERDAMQSFSQVGKSAFDGYGNLVRVTGTTLERWDGHRWSVMSHGSRENGNIGTPPDWNS